jgi:phosphohistidine phosphatase
MRYLTIVRHAKASPAGAGESDFSRALNGRGRRQCEQLRAWAQDPDALGRYGPTTALVSSAARTRETFERSFAGTTFVLEHHYSDLIYNGARDVGAQDILIDLAAIDPVTRSLLVVAHNPSVYELLLSLAASPPKSVLRDGYPLAGAFVLALGDNEQVGLAKYELVASLVPD